MEGKYDNFRLNDKKQADICVENDFLLKKPSLAGYLEKVRV